MLVSILIAALIFVLVVWLAREFIPAPYSRIVVAIAAVIAIIYLIGLLTGTPLLL